MRIVVVPPSGRSCSGVLRNEENVPGNLDRCWLNSSQPSPDSWMRVGGRWVEGGGKGESHVKSLTGRSIYLYHSLQQRNITFKITPLLPLPPSSHNFLLTMFTSGQKTIAVDDPMGFDGVKPCYLVSENKGNRCYRIVSGQPYRNFRN